MLYSSTNTVNGGNLGFDGRIYYAFKGAKVGANKRKASGIYSVEPHDWSDWRLEVNSWGGKPFNSPNDVVMKRSDGSLWFTDPIYGYAQGSGPPAVLGNWVYRLDPKTKMASVVADGFVRPNGIAFSPDESVAYVSDTGSLTGWPGDRLWVGEGARAVYAFDVVNGRHLANRRLLYMADTGVPDAIKVDSDGRLYLGCADGVHVVSPQGDLLAKMQINTLAHTANLCFGRGDDSDKLYIASKDVISLVALGTVRGQPVGKERVPSAITSEYEEVTREYGSTEGSGQHSLGLGLVAVMLVGLAAVVGITRGGRHGVAPAPTIL